MQYVTKLSIPYYGHLNSLTRLLSYVMKRTQTAGFLGSFQLDLFAKLSLKSRKYIILTVHYIQNLKMLEKSTNHILHLQESASLLRVVSNNFKGLS